MSITKAGLVAQELRKLAEGLEREPDAEIERPWLSFYNYEKEPFLAIAKLLPRPLQKKVESDGTEYARIRLSYVSEGLDLWASVPQSKTCEIVQPARPAVYRCEPILSQLEEESVAE